MQHERKAFTLVELLTVIAILGLLIGILLPSLASARRSAKASVCLSTMKNIGNAFVFYLNENEDTFPPFRLKKIHPSAPDDPPYANALFREAPRWQWFLLMDQGPPIDPTVHLLQRGDPTMRWSDTKPYGELDNRGRKMTVDTFSCPALDDLEFENDIRDGAFGYNYQYLGNTRTDTDSKRWDNFPVSLHQTSSPAKTVLVADSRGAGRLHGPHSYTLDPPRLAIERDATRFGPSEDDVPDVLAPELYAYSPVEARHKDQGNLIFIDGHGEGLTLTELGYAHAEGQKVVKPVRAPDEAGKWDNSLWTGTGRDRFSEERPREGQ